MRKTTALGLSLYEADDKFAITPPEDSLNHNMELIDQAVSSIHVKSLYDVIKEAGYTGTEEEFNSAVLNLANETIVAGSIRGNSEFTTDSYGPQIDLSGSTILLSIDNHTKKYDFTYSGLLPVYPSNQPLNLGSSTNPWGSIYGDSIKSIDTADGKACSITFNNFNKQIEFRTPTTNLPIVIKGNSIYPEHYSNSFVTGLGTTIEPWTNVYAKNIYIVNDASNTVAVATKTDTEAIETTLSTKSNQLTEGENVRLIPNDDGTITVSAFEGFNTDLKELSLIASGEITTEPMNKVIIDKDADGNALQLRDFVWVHVEVPIAAQDTKLSVWLDSNLSQINSGVSSTNAKTDKLIAFFTGRGWDNLAASVNNGNEYVSVQTKMKAFREATNSVSSITIGCYNSAHTLPVGTTYEIYGRKI